MGCSSLSKRFLLLSLFVVGVPNALKGPLFVSAQSSDDPITADCTVESANDPNVDDSLAILNAFKKCSTDSVIAFPPANYTVHTPIALVGLENVTVVLNGNLLLPNNISRVQQEIQLTQNRPSTYATPWIYIQGNNVQIRASEDVGWGQIHGFGQQWWDLGIRTLRPQLATFNVTNGILRNLKVIKPIAWGWNLPGKNILVENHFVDAQPRNATRESTTSFPFNTDGFNLSGQNITIDGYFGHNGDDCVSVVNGARDIVAKNGYCGFSSHGLSIGSLGRNGQEHTVQNVLFKNWTMDGAVYGARFKSWTGGQGWADNVVWEDIVLINVSTGIFITQNYYDQDKGPRPDNSNKTSTRVSNFSYRNITGTLGTNWTDGSCISNPCWNHVEGLDEPKAIIFDLYEGTAFNISLSDVNIHPFSRPGESANVLCNPASLNDNEKGKLGFKCANGAFEATPIRSAAPRLHPSFTFAVIVTVVQATIVGLVVSWVPF